MLPSEYEELVFKAAVIQKVAIELGIKETAVLAASELLPLIQGRNREVAAALHDFLEAHKAWSDFHVGIEKDARFGQLTSSERTALASLVERRDRTRNTLLKALEAVTGNP